MTEDETIEGREIADLLPFYAAGTLRADERSRVDAALRQNAELRRELALVEEEREAAVAVSEALGVPSRAASQRLFAMIDAGPRPAARFDLAGWLSAKLDGLRPRTMAYATGFACLLLVVQAGVIGKMMSSRSGGGGFETASVETTGVAGTVVVVAFAPDARAGEIDKLLADTKASIVAGPLAGGLYQLRIGDKLLSTAARDKVIETLKGRKAVIRFVAPASAEPE